MSANVELIPIEMVPFGHLTSKPCPKCGGQKWHTRHVPQWTSNEMFRWKQRRYPEHNCVSCAACGFEGVEAPATTG